MLSKCDKMEKGVRRLDWCWENIINVCSNDLSTYADAMVDKDPVTKRSRTVTKIIPSLSGARLFHVSNRRKRRTINITQIRYIEHPYKYITTTFWLKQTQPLFSSFSSLDQTCTCTYHSTALSSISSLAFDSPPSPLPYLLTMTIMILLPSHLLAALLTTFFLVISAIKFLFCADWHYT